MTGPATSLAAEEAARNPRLDGVRGLAILPVMLYHLTFFGAATGAAGEAITFLPSLGWTSVDLFFVLSGFLITGILRRTRGSGHYFRNFYARRALRIFPLYYAVLVFFFVIAPHVRSFGDPAKFWVAGADQQTLWYWLYLQNLHVAWTGQFDHHFLGIVWTLCIEEQFYLVWPMLLLGIATLASRTGGSADARPARTRRWLTIAMIVVALASFGYSVAAVASGTAELQGLGAWPVGGWLRGVDCD